MEKTPVELDLLATHQKLTIAETIGALTPEEAIQLGNTAFLLLQDADNLSLDENTRKNLVIQFVKFGQSTE